MGSRRRGTQHRREAQGFRQMVLKRSSRTTGGQVGLGNHQPGLDGLNGRPVEGQTGLRGSLDGLVHGMVVELYSSFESKLRPLVINTHKKEEKRQHR